MKNKIKVINNSASFSLSAIAEFESRKQLNVNGWASIIGDKEPPVDLENRNLSYFNYPE